MSSLFAFPVQGAQKPGMLHRLPQEVEVIECLRQASEALDEEGLEQRLGVPHVQLRSIRQVRDGLWDHLLSTYRNASVDCDGQPFCPRVRSVAELRQLAAAFTGDISPAHALWASKSQGVHEQVLNEQLRVAVLRP